MKSYITPLRNDHCATRLPYLVSLCLIFPHFSRSTFTPRAVAIFAFVDRQGFPSRAKRQFDAFTRNLSRYETRCHYRLALPQCFYKGNTLRRGLIFYLFARWYTFEWRKRRTEKKEFSSLKSKGNGLDFSEIRRFLGRVFSASLKMKCFKIESNVVANVWLISAINQQHARYRASRTWKHHFTTFYESLHRLTLGFW